MQHPKEEEARPYTTLAELTEGTTYTSGKQRPPCRLPTISPEMRLKWGLSLLGEEKAFAYLQWLQQRLKDSQ